MNPTISRSILVIAEVVPDGGTGPTISPVTYEALGTAQLLANGWNGGTGQPAGRVDVVLVGSGVRSLADDLAAHGAGRVFVADASSLASYVAEIYLPAIEQAVQQAAPAVVLLGHTLAGRELSPRLAFRLDCAAVTDCVALRVEPSGALALTKPVYGGSALAEYVMEDPTACLIATLRPRTFEPAARQDGRQPDLVELAVAAGDTAQQAQQIRVVDTVREATEGPRLKEAKVVVSGGRGLGGPEHWHLVEELAAVLGGAVGATRAVTDAGWVPSTHQVGLTGTTVTPDLYVAAGISGAVQHIAGCSGARNIVAINRDPEANIFKYARFGVVGDARQVLPSLTQRIDELRPGT